MIAYTQPAGIKLQSLLVADAIYRDEGSGKYVIAGVFHQINVPAFPTTFARSIGIFVSLSGLTGKANIDIEFFDSLSGEVLLRMRSLQISCDGPNQPVDFAVEVPPLPLPHSGSYQFRLLANGGLLGTTSVLVKAPEEDK